MALEVKRQYISNQKHKASHFYHYFCPKMEFRTYFAYFRTLSETQSLMDRLWKYGSRLADHISVFPVVT